MEDLTGNNTAPALNLSLEQVHKRILKLVEQGHRNSHQIGRLYNYVVDFRLAQKGGFKDAQDFFKQRVKVVSQAVLSLNGAVARAFTEDVAVKYGMRNLSTLLSYAKLEGRMVDQSDPGALIITVPQKDGTVLPKPFADCSVEDLQNAVNHKRSPVQPLPEAAVARVQHYRDNLQRHFTDRISIRVDARNHLGELFITLRDIPEKEMKRLAAALADEGLSSPVSTAAQAPAPSDTPVAEAPAVSPAQGMAHNDDTAVPVSPAARAQSTVNEDTSTSSVSLAQAHPAVVAPIEKAPGAGQHTPSQPASPVQGAPRTTQQGLGGFFRRMAGGESSRPS